METSSVEGLLVNQRRIDICCFTLSLEVGAVVLGWWRLRESCGHQLICDKPLAITMDISLRQRLQHCRFRVPSAWGSGCRPWLPGCSTVVLVRAARAAVVACLIVQSAPGIAGPLGTRLGAEAGRCFERAGTSRCDVFWDLSAALKQRADDRGLLRCYTSVLSLEAVVAMAMRGARDPGAQQAAIEVMTRDCP